MDHHSVKLVHECAFLEVLLLELLVSLLNLGQKFLFGHLWLRLGLGLRCFFRLLVFCILLFAFWLGVFHWLIGLGILFVLLLWRLFYFVFALLWCLLLLGFCLFQTLLLDLLDDCCVVLLPLSSIWV